MQRCSFIALLKALFSVDGYNAFFFFTYLHRQQKVAEELDSHLLKQSKASTPGNLQYIPDSPGLHIQTR